MPRFTPSWCNGSTRGFEPLCLSSNLSEGIMKDTFKSRYNQKRTITEQGDGSYLVEGESRYYRCGANEGEDSIWMVDFEGGPFIAVGDPLLGTKEYGTVTRIEILKEQKEGSFAVKVFCE